MRENEIRKYNRTKKYNLFIIIIVFTGIYGCASSRIQKENKPFYFVQMADPQFGMFSENKDFSRETANFEKAVTEVNLLHPSFAIVCGDLVNETGNPQQIAEFKRIAATINSSIPLYLVAGNHDVGNQPTEKSLVEYRKTFSPDYYSFISGNMFGIVLNSSLFEDPINVPKQAKRQEKWLLSQLKQAHKKGYSNIVVFQHIPWFVEEPDEKNGYFNIPLERRIKYLDLLYKYGVKMVFAGHVHKNSYGNYKGIEMVTSGPVGKPLGKDPSGLRIVKVSKDSITSRYYSLDSLPQLENRKIK